MQLTKDYLSKENGNSVKGIFAVVILLHHISQFNYVKMPYYVFLLIQSAGYLSVGIFFALSGYGLSVQAQTKKDYLKTFWLHRILPLYLHYVVFMLLYLVFFIGIGRKFTALEIVRSLLLYPTIVTNGWFFFSILILYVLFWIVHSVAKEPLCRDILMAAGLLMYCGAGIALKWGYWIYISVFAFLLGMIWQQYREKLDAFASSGKSWWYGLLAGIFLFGMTFLFSHMYRLPEWCYMSLKAVSCVFFSGLVFWMLQKIPVRNFLTDFLGKYSLAFYACQGIILYFLTNELHLTEPVKYLFFAVTGTLLLAFPVNRGYGRIRKFLQKQS